MNTPISRALVWSLAALALPATSFAAKLTSDIAPPLKRQATVKLALEFANRKNPPPLPADLPSPFNPPDFDKPDGTEAIAAGANRTTVPVPSGGGRSGSPTTGGAPTPGQPPPPQPAGDRAVLEMVAARIPSLGMISLGGKPQLLLGNGKRAGVGDVFTVTDGDRDYDLEIVAIDRTTFTLRYRGEEITRAIKLAK